MAKQPFHNSLLPIRIFFISVLLLIFHCSFSQKTGKPDTSEQLAPGNKLTDSLPCSNVLLGNISFSPGSAKLSKAALTIIDSIYMQIKKSTVCRIKITVCVNDITYKAEQLSWDRVYTIIYHLKKKGIEEERFIFNYVDLGKSTIASVVLTDEGGPYIVPAPVPNLSTLKDVPWLKQKRAH